MIVILDSTVFDQQPHPVGMIWNRLRDWKDRETARILVPRIVIEEAARSFRSSLRETSQNLDANLRRMNKLLPNHSDWRHPPINLDDAEANYTQSLLTDLRQYRIEVVEHGGLSLPFRPEQSTKGAIIWELVQKFLRETDHSATIISRNTREFGRASQMPAFIASEFERQGISSHRIQQYSRLQTFVKEYVRKRTKRFDTIVDAIENDRHPNFCLSTLFVNHRDDILDALTELIDDWRDLPSHFNTAEFDSPKITHISEVAERSCIDACQNEGGEIDIFVTYWVDGGVRCKLKNSDSNGFFSGRLTFNLSVSCCFDPDSGDVYDFQVGDLGYWLWPGEWPDREAA